MIQVNLLFVFFFLNFDFVANTLTKIFFYGNDDKKNIILETAKQWKNALLNACNVIIKNEKRLNDLDSTCGDGDCGSSLKDAAKGVQLFFEFY